MDNSAKTTSEDTSSYEADAEAPESGTGNMAGADAADNVVDAQWRPEYRGTTLPLELPPAPWDIVNPWLRAAAEGAADGDAEPNAVAFATADAAGLPDVRIVLVKSASPEGFVVYSDAGSAKAQQIAENPQAALAFYWPRSTQQIRARGVVEMVDAEVAAQYFRTRPRESQIAATASHQSEVIDSLKDLQDRYQAVRAELADEQTVPVPEHWIGFLLRPTSIEVWAGNTDRLHDRAAYQASAPSKLDDAQAWSVQRLQP